MSNMTASGIVADRATFNAYCARHAVAPEAALAELVVMALTLPADVLDYLRAERGFAGAAVFALG